MCHPKRSQQFQSIGSRNQNHMPHFTICSEHFTLHLCLLPSLAMGSCYGYSHRMYHLCWNFAFEILFCFLIVGDFSAKSLRTPSNVFVINLALCDFMMMSKTPIFIYNSFNHGYALGSAGCQIFALVGALSGIGAAITNACIAYDRLHKTELSQNTKAK